MKPNKDSNGIKISLLVQKVTDLAIGNSSTWTILLLSWVKITPSWLLQVLSTKCVAGKDGFVAVDHAHHEDGLGAVHKVRERFFFAIIDTPFPQAITFLYPSVITFSSIFGPFPLKSVYVLYGWPLTALRKGTQWEFLFVSLRQEHPSIEARTN